MFGIGAPGRDYRMTTGRWDRGRAIGGNLLTRLRVIREQASRFDLDDSWPEGACWCGWVFGGSAARRTLTTTAA
jgi:hypothetical protein